MIRRFANFVVCFSAATTFVLTLVLCPTNLQAEAADGPNRAAETTTSPPAAVEDSSDEVAAKDSVTPKSEDSLSKSPPSTSPSSTASPSTSELRVLSFKGIEAGITTVDEVQKSWGTPRDSFNQDGLSILVFDIHPFKSVEYNVEEGRVMSTVIYLKSPMRAGDLADQLNLSHLHAVTIVDERQEVLGKAFPERGTTFGFHPDASPDDEMVAHIYLEPISAETFLLRAKSDTQHQYQRSLRDVNVAIGLEPRYAEAHNFKAHHLRKTGQLIDAARAADRATELDPHNFDYLLTRARISLTLGQSEQAHEDVKRVLEQDRIPAHVRATALLLAGDLMFNSPQSNYQEAMNYHQRAIEVATPLASDHRFAVRRRAKNILVDAHVAVAKEVAFGNWKNKKKAVPKWLDRAAAIAEEMISHDQGDPLLRLTVSQDALATLTGIRNEVNPEQIAKATIARAEKLEASATDPLFQRQISWILGKALVDVLRIEHAQGEAESAKKYGAKAVKLLESTVAYSEDSPEHSLLLGEAYFRLGSVYAILLEDHPTAITWYEKATRLLEKPRPVIRPLQEGQTGEWFVSMGVSYWETRDRATAIELTKFGVRLMEGATQTENIPQDSLEIPYSNLAHMYDQIGDQRRAEQFSELMAKAGGEAESETTKR